MRLVRCGEAATARASAEYFTGDVWQSPIVQAEAPARVMALAVTFAPGGRTFWHTHPLGQTLHVLSGCGWFQSRGMARVAIRAGDTVWIAPGEEHWHGATDTTMMVHLAIQEREGEAAVAWLEPVSEAEYRGD